MRVSVSRGNLQKLLQVPLVGLGTLAALVTPRSPTRWVFGCGSGVGEGALTLALAARSHGYDIAWVARTERDEAAAHAHGLRTVRGWGAFVATLRAGVVVMTHGFGDVSRYGVHGAFVVNLWHGIPLKRLHLDAPGFLRLPGVPDLPIVRRVLETAHRRSARRIRLFPVASERVASRIRSGFGLDDDVVRVLGDARVDVLAAPSEAARDAARAHIEATGIRSASTTVLYAPTWRDGRPDPAVPDAAQWDRIASWLEARDARLLVRSHPLGAGDYAAGAAASDRIRVLGHDRVADVTPVLLGVDVVVTDFSSIAYDAAIVGIPTLFLSPDVAAYESMRGLYDDYDALSGRHETTWDGVLAWADALRDPAALAERTAHAARLVAETQQLTGGATERVLHTIEGALGIGQGPEVPLAATPLRVVWRDGDELVVEGEAERAPVGARLRGQRRTLPGRVDVHGDRFVARLPLTASVWGSAATALSTGMWVVELLDDTGARMHCEAPVALPAPEIALEMRLSVRRGEGSIILDVAPPIADDERGRRAQRDLERRFLDAPEPELAVMLESFYGQSASCNPLAIDRALAGLRPDIRRYWSTRDASVPIPDGATRVIEGTREWWRVRGAARALIVNDWLRKRQRPLPHQRVLQTWHGTPLKRLALERARVSLRTRIATVREGRRWSAMLAQNEHSEQHFRAAYAFRGPVWQLGYPRGDALVRADALAIRARVGVREGARVVLYAPTWRDDRAAVVDFVDVAELATRLGDGFHVVVRGHSRSLAAGHDLSSAGVIDATTYPDTADLLAIADVLVTDYSSVMFDFAATGRPIVFAVPDIDDYRDRLRGFTLDFAQRAPGPFAHDLDTLVARIQHAEAEREEWAGRLHRWRADFTPRDDGAAAERVVRRLVDAGWFAPLEPHARARA